MTADRRSRSRPDVLLVGDLASVHVRRLAAGLVDAGVAVLAAGFDGDPIDGVTVVRLGDRPASDDRRYPLAIPRLARLLRQRRPRLVNAHYLSSYGLLATAAMRLAYPLGQRPHLVQTVWGTDVLVTARGSRVRGLLARRALQAADLVTSDSEELAGEVGRLAPRTPHHRFVFGPPIATFERVHRPGRTFVSTRRLDPDTRVTTVVEGFRAARAGDPAAMDGWMLVVAGDGRASDDVRHAAGDDPAVSLAGQLPADALADLLARASATVSMPVSDGTSAALLEAMAAGLVPIVNDLPANREWVDLTVGIVMPRDPSAADVAAAILRSIDGPFDVEAIRARVRGVAWEDEVRRLVAAFGAIPGHAREPNG